MKKIILSICTFALLLSCQNEVTLPGLSVQIAESSVAAPSEDGSYIIQAGKELLFRLESDADLVLVYTGDAGHEYAKRNNTLADGHPKLDFYYTGNRLSAATEIWVYASTDFKGAYNEQNIQAATWDDLTPTEMKTYYVNAAKKMPTISLEQYRGGKPIFIAYRLRVPSTARYANPTISNFKITNELLNGQITTVVDNCTNAGFTSVTISENETWKALGAGSSMWRITSNNLNVNTASFDPNQNDGKFHDLWSVSKMLYLDKADPDRGVTVQNIQTREKEYVYTYAKPGKYTVTFVAYNTRYGNTTESVLKEFVVQVTP